MWAVRVLMGGGVVSRLFMGLYVWTTVWNSQDSISVHQSNTALHIQPQQRLSGVSESLSSGWVAVLSVHRLPFETLRVMNTDPGGASGFEETVVCVSASPSGGRMRLEGLSQIM